MAKKGYPGLVLVPPSDRTILRRRLLHWSLFLIALIWSAWTLIQWLPSLNDKTNCPPGVGDQASISSPEQCGHTQAAAESPSNQSEFNLTQVSQAEGLGESPPPAPSPIPDPDQLATHSNHSQDSKPHLSEPINHPTDHSTLPPSYGKTTSSVPASQQTQNQESDIRVADQLLTQHNRSQDSKSKSSELVNRPTDRSVVPPNNEQSASRIPGSKPMPKLDADVRGADQLTTQHNHSQDSKPGSSELVPHPIEHTVAPPGHEKSTSRLSTSRPAQDLDIDTRLAEQGDAFAQYRLGRYYAQRDGRQTPESVSWYKKASPGLHRLAENGNGQAMYVLGVMYAYGRGVTRSTDEARRWLTRAIEHKITAAQLVLTSLETNHRADPKLPVSNQVKNMSQHH